MTKPLPSDFVHTDNMSLFWAECVMLKPELDTHITDYMIKRLRVEPGLFSRKPDNGGLLEARDNYIGLLYLRPELIEEINEYGKANYYCYNNHNPGRITLVAFRPPSDIGLYKILARENTLSRVIFETVFIIHVLVSSFGRGAGGKILTHLMLKTLDNVDYNPPWYLLARYVWKKKTGPMEPYYKTYHLTDPIRSLSDGLEY